MYVGLNYIHMYVCMYTSSKNPQGLKPVFTADYSLPIVDYSLTHMKG